MRLRSPAFRPASAASAGQGASSAAPVASSATSGGGRAEGSRSGSFGASAGASAAASRMDSPPRRERGGFGEVNGRGFGSGGTASSSTSPFRAFSTPGHVLGGGGPGGPSQSAAASSVHGPSASAPPVDSLGVPASSAFHFSGGQTFQAQANFGNSGGTYTGSNTTHVGASNVRLG
jgi:hypothetical protein